LRWVVLALLVGPTAGVAAAAPRGDCLDRLDDLGVPYRVAAPTRGVETPVEVEGPLGGVTYVPGGGRPRRLVLDCSLVYSLALAGPFFVAEGLTVAVYSDSYERRFVRGTRRWSKHSFGLALDVHRWQSPDDPARRLTVLDHYETGLGRGRDCLGRPGDARARSLRLLWCRLWRSELFRLVLDPDFDAGHRDHFHMQAAAWAERTDLDWRRPPAAASSAGGGGERRGARAREPQRDVEEGEGPDEPQGGPHPG
jgi:hypothetical protein